MSRHTNFTEQITEETIDFEIETERQKAISKHGLFNSAHEGWAVMAEELEEFWESVRADDPDPVELLQLAACAKTMALQICAKHRGSIHREGRDH